MNEIKIETSTLRMILHEKIDSFYEETELRPNSKNRFVESIIQELEQKDHEKNNIKAAENTVKKICELFHLQETTDWEQKAKDLLIDYKLG